MSVTLVLARRRWPAGLAAWAAYGAMLAPVSGLAHAGPQLVADRFSYLPSLALTLLLGAGVVAATRQALLAPILGHLIVNLVQLRRLADVHRGDTAGLFPDD